MISMVLDWFCMVSEQILFCTPIPQLRKNPTEGIIEYHQAPLKQQRKSSILEQLKLWAGWKKTIHCSSNCLFQSQVSAASLTKGVAIADLAANQTEQCVLWRIGRVVIPPRESKILRILLQNIWVQYAFRTTPFLIQFSPNITKLKLNPLL